MFHGPLVNTPKPTPLPRTSRERYRRFVEDYRRRRLDDIVDGDGKGPVRASV